MPGSAFLRELVRHVALAFDAKFAFVADRVDALSGGLQVESPPGTGTSVRAHLPVRPLG